MQLLCKPIVLLPVSHPIALSVAYQQPLDCGANWHTSDKQSRAAATTTAETIVSAADPFASFAASVHWCEAEAIKSIAQPIRASGQSTGKARADFRLAEQTAAAFGTTKLAWWAQTKWLKSKLSRDEMSIDCGSHPNWSDESERCRGKKVNTRTQFSNSSIIRELTCRREQRLRVAGSERLRVATSFGQRIDGMRAPRAKRLVCSFSRQIAFGRSQSDHSICLAVPLKIRLTKAPILARQLNLNGEE